MGADNTKLKKRPRKARGKLLPLAFIGPHLILFIVFVLFPIIYGVVISFAKWDMIGTPQWVGLDNYKEILFNTESTFHRDFMEGLGNTVLFVVLNVPVSILVPLIFALLQMLNKRFGLVSLFGIDKALTVTNPWMWIMLILMSVWWTMGTNMVIYQAAISSVSKDLYESAELDGAGTFKRIWYITLPSIRFQLLYTLVITIAGSFNVYGQPLMLTQQGTGGAAKITVLIMTIRNLAFGSGQSIAGMASAMAVMLGVFILIVSLIQFRLATKDD